MSIKLHIIPPYHYGVYQVLFIVPKAYVPHNQNLCSHSQRQQKTTVPNTHTHTKNTTTTLTSLPAWRASASGNPRAPSVPPRSSPHRPHRRRRRCPTRRHACACVPACGRGQLSEAVRESCDAKQRQTKRRRLNLSKQIRGKGWGGKHRGTSLTLPFRGGGGGETES